MEHLRGGKGKHGNAHAEPADLGQTDEEGGQVGAHLSKGSLGQQIQGHACGASDVAEPSGIAAEDQAADEDGQDKAGEIQTIAQAGAYRHTGGEEGEAKHNKKHGPEFFPGCFWDGFQGVIGVRDSGLCGGCGHSDLSFSLVMGGKKRDDLNGRLQKIAHQKGKESPHGNECENAGIPWCLPPFIGSYHTRTLGQRQEEI
jgi:hypothetical protein